MNVRGNKEKGYSVRSSNGSLSFKKFDSVYDWSLDSIKVQNVYESLHPGEEPFAFKSGKLWYTTNIVCVTFNYSYKEFNLAGKKTYVKNGFLYRDLKFEDCLCFVNGELVGVQTDVLVQNPVDQEMLGNYFAFDGETYVLKKSLPTIMDKSQLRDYLYRNGFICDGKKYVRYKRSAGSSRVGKCLFIIEELANAMAEYDKCGLNINDGDAIDLAAYESYISLPMSSIIDIVEIPLDSILVIDDYISEFEDEVIGVRVEDDTLVSKPERVVIENNIWDGQSLLDKSMFGKYEDKGMILLRNRFFKSCCFNTNLTQFFKDNDIHSIEQLKGFTLATDISQIKMVTTKSSIKFAKFGSIKQWLDNIDPVFGLVKYEKSPKRMNGLMVQCHYQLLNTLHCNYGETESILQDTLDYIKAVRKDPTVLRYDIQYPDEIDDLGDEPIKTKNEIVFKLLGMNADFANTKLYREFRDDLVRGKIRNLKQGHVLINGNYSTMIGNGLEMLYATIGKFTGESLIGYGNVCTKRFGINEELLCSRSPHVTMGNLLLVRNIKHLLVDKYFNMTNEIVYVNAINENIQQRLNG